MISVEVRSSGFSLGLIILGTYNMVKKIQHSIDYGKLILLNSIRTKILINIKQTFDDKVQL